MTDDELDNDIATLLLLASQINVRYQAALSLAAKVCDQLSEDDHAAYHRHLIDAGEAQAKFQERYFRVSEATLEMLSRGEPI